MKVKWQVKTCGNDGQGKGLAHSSTGSATARRIELEPETGNVINVWNHLNSAADLSS
jgi:hypothetical protein